MFRMVPMVPMFRMDIVFSPNVNWECYKFKEISWIIMGVVLLEKVLIRKNSKI